MAHSGAPNVRASNGMELSIASAWTEVEQQATLDNLKMYTHRYGKMLYKISNYGCVRIVLGIDVGARVCAYVCVCVYEIVSKIKVFHLMVAVFVVGRVVNVGSNDFIIIMHILCLNDFDVSKWRIYAVALVFAVCSL